MFDTRAPNTPSVPPTNPRPPTPKPRTGWRLLLPLMFVLASITFALFAFLMIIFASLGKTIPVTVIIDGAATTLDTHHSTVNQLLTDLGIDAAGGDSISHTGETTLRAEMIIRVDRARNVSLVVDGVGQILWTSRTNPLDILQFANVTVSDDDLIMVDGTLATRQNLAQWPVPASQIVVRHVLPLTVEIIGEGTQSILTTASTVGDALFEADITVFISDTVSAEMNAALQPNMHITIRRANPVSIIVDGETIRTRIQGSTVADALAEADVALVGLDYAVPAENTALIGGMSIRIIRVREEFVSEEVETPYETLRQADPNTEIDQQSLIQSGQNGLTRTTYRIRYENNIQISREVESTETVREHRNHIVGFGTKIVIHTLDTPEGQIQYWRRITMYATSYHPAALGGDNITATGRTLVKGIVAANPTVLPYGTQVYVPGYGMGDVQDTGGPRQRMLWIDLGYSDHDWRSWSRPIDVYLLAPAPDPSQIDYILPAR